MCKGLVPCWPTSDDIDAEQAEVPMTVSIMHFFLRLPPRLMAGFFVFRSDERDHAAVLHCLRTSAVCFRCLF